MADASLSKGSGQQALPPIDITKSRFDLNTYYGRLRHFITITSPLTLLRSEADLRRAQDLLRDYASRKRPDLDLSSSSQEQIWEAKQLVESSLHPDTHEPIPVPFRLSAFVPTNLVIATGLLLPNPSLASIVGWQWANQTLNVCVNYANANKSTSLSTHELATAYGAAAATSVGLAVGLSRLAKKVAAGSMLGRFVPFVAVASAGCVNLSLMRWKEIREGIDVFSPGEESSQSLGKSKVAGMYAVGQTAASRVLTNIPILIIPPLVLATLHKRGTFGGPKGKYFEMIANLGLIGGSLFIFLPPAIATFPQRATLPISRLEQPFHGLVNPSTGLPYTTVEFSKGL